MCVKLKLSVVSTVRAASVHHCGQPLMASEARRIKLRVQFGDAPESDFALRGLAESGRIQLNPTKNPSESHRIKVNQSGSKCGGFQSPKSFQYGVRNLKWRRELFAGWKSMPAPIRVHASKSESFRPQFNFFYYGIYRKTFRLRKVWRAETVSRPFVPEPVCARLAVLK